MKWWLNPNSGPKPEYIEFKTWNGLLLPYIHITQEWYRFFIRILKAYTITNPVTLSQTATLAAKLENISGVHITLIRSSFLLLKLIV